MPLALVVQRQPLAVGVGADTQPPWLRMPSGNSFGPARDYPFTPYFQVNTHPNTQRAGPVVRAQIAGR